MPVEQVVGVERDEVARRRRPPAVGVEAIDPVGRGGWGPGHAGPPFSSSAAARLVTGRRAGGGVPPRDGGRVVTGEPGPEIRDRDHRRGRVRPGGGPHVAVHRHADRSALGVQPVGDPRSTWEMTMRTRPSASTWACRPLQLMRRWSQSPESNQCMVWIDQFQYRASGRSCSTSSAWPAGRSQHPPPYAMLGAPPGGVLGGVKVLWGSRSRVAATYAAQKSMDRSTHRPARSSASATPSGVGGAAGKPAVSERSMLNDTTGSGPSRTGTGG